MIPLWVYVGFGAQLLWVLGAIIDKTLLEKYFEDEATESAEVLLFVSGCFSALITLGLTLFFFGDLSFNQNAVLTGLLAGIFGGLWVHLYLRALDTTETSRVIPIFQSIPIFGLLFAYIALGEVLSQAELIGIFLVLIGAFVLSFNWSSRKWLLMPTLLMLLASVCVALQETLFKVTSEGTTWGEILIEPTSYWSAVILMTGGLTIYSLTVYLCNKNARAVFRSTFAPHSQGLWWASAINEVIDNAAGFLFWFAITLGPVALVQATNSFQPLITLIAVTILAKFFGNHLKEDISFQNMTQKILGISIITAGSVLLYLSIT